jgi:hypothetical protein
MFPTYSKPVELRSTVRAEGRTHLACATECPRISRDFLEEERRGSAVFGRDLVEAALHDDVEPLWE